MPGDKMFHQVSKRSLYDMFELRSEVQKMIRCFLLLKGGWREFHYFVEEYLNTMMKNPSTLLLFLMEDCGRCHLDVLRCILKLLLDGKHADRLDYHAALEALAKQPVDRSAAYLSVACLAYLEPLKPLVSATKPWETMVTSGGTEFAACMEHITRETEAASAVYPMSTANVLRLAGAVTHLDHWQSRYPDSLLCRALALDTVWEVLDKRLRPRSPRVRPLILGLMVVTRWMQRVGRDAIPEEARTLVWLILEATMACCGLNTTRVHLSANAALLVLAGRLPQAKTEPQVVAVDLTDVPTGARMYPMPAFAQDRHTKRGKNMLNTLRFLENHCRKHGWEMPSNPEYSHGPSAHATPQGFDEFMEHVRWCEEQNGDGIEPWFKQEAVDLYRAQSPKNRKRMAIVKTKLGDLAPVAPTRKRKRNPTGDKDPVAKRRCVDWIREHAPDDLREGIQWEVLSRERPIAQLRAGGKPPVILDSPDERVFKGPFAGHEAPLRSACLTKLARNVFGLSHCVPKVEPVVGDDGGIGLASPMIGRAAKTSAGLSKNADRGLCKLHEYKEGWIGSIANAIDVLKIVVVKNLVLSSDNNTSNVLVENDTRRVYGVDFGGWMKPKRTANANEAACETSLKWAFSKPPNKNLLGQLDNLAKQHAIEMSGWLRSFQTEEVRRHYREVSANYPVNVAPTDYSERLDLFVSHFERLSHA